MRLCSYNIFSLCYVFSGTIHCPDICDRDCTPSCGVIEPETIYGAYTDNYFAKWEIQMLYDVTVFFKEFDIGCTGDTTFVIYDNENNPHDDGGLLLFSYCNKNIPIGGMSFVKFGDVNTVYIEFDMKRLPQVNFLY